MKFYSLLEALNDPFRPEEGDGNLSPRSLRAAMVMYSRLRDMVRDQLMPVINFLDTNQKRYPEDSTPVPNIGVGAYVWNRYETPRNEALRKKALKVNQQIGKMKQVMMSNQHHHGDQLHADEVSKLITHIDQEIEDLVAEVHDLHRRNPDLFIRLTRRDKPPSDSTIVYYYKGEMFVVDPGYDDEPAVVRMKAIGDEIKQLILRIASL